MTETAPFFDFSKVDKSGFVCLKFEDQSLYYGELSTFNEQGELVSEEVVSKYNQDFEKKVKENPETSHQKKIFKKKRHGTGAQIFLRPDGSVLCKYEGNWAAGLKDGDGVATYPDGSIYAGSSFLISQGR